MPDSILPSLTPTGAPARAPRRLTRSTLVLLIGLQLLLAFLAYDIASVPRNALGRLLAR